MKWSRLETGCKHTLCRPAAGRLSGQYQVFELDRWKSTKKCAKASWTALQMSVTHKKQQEISTQQRHVNGVIPIPSLYIRRRLRTCRFFQTRRQQRKYTRVSTPFADQALTKRIVFWYYLEPVLVAVAKAVWDDKTIVRNRIIHIDISTFSSSSNVDT